MRRTVSVLFVLLSAGALGSTAAFAGPAAAPPPTVAPTPVPSPKIEKLPTTGMPWSAFPTNMNEAAGNAARQWIASASITNGYCRGSQLILSGNALENRTVDVYTSVHDSLVAHGAREIVAAGVARGFVWAWVAWAFGYTVNAPDIFPDFASLAPTACHAGRTTPGSRGVSLSAGSTAYPLNAAGIRSSIIAQINVLPGGHGITAEPGAETAIMQFASMFEARFNVWYGTAKLSNLTCDARGAFGEKPNYSCAGSVSASQTLNAGGASF